MLASTGFCGRELYAIEDRPNHLYMVGSMGCVVPLALGLALARPDLRVVALDGDGAALMRMGAFATVGAYGPPNLRHLLLDNGAHDSTGGQATVSPNVSFAQVAAACGYASSLETDALSAISAWLDLPPLDGPALRAPADAPRESRGSAPTVDNSGRRQDTSDATLRSPNRSAVMLLLNPGPVTLSERVRRSLLQPDLCHRESEFFDLQDEARTRLLAVYGLNPAEWTAVLMTGSGTAAVESMMASVVPEGGRVLIVENGVYGERIAQMCAQYRISHERIVGSWMEAPDVAAITARLDAASGEAPFHTPFGRSSRDHHGATE